MFVSFVTNEKFFVTVGRGYRGWSTESLSDTIELETRSSQYGTKVCYLSVLSLTLIE